MNPALDDGITRLGMALLHFVWQGALIGCVSAVGLALLRNARSQTRYAFCGLAMLLCVALPLWHVLTPAEPRAPSVEMLRTHVDLMTVAEAGRAPALSAATLQPRLPSGRVRPSAGFRRPDPTQPERLALPTRCRASETSSICPRARRTSRISRRSFFTTSRSNAGRPSITTGGRCSPTASPSTTTVSDARTTTPVSTSRRGETTGTVPATVCTRWAARAPSRSRTVPT